MPHPSSCIFSLLPPPRDGSVTSRIRSAATTLVHILEQNVTSRIRSAATTLVHILEQNFLHLRSNSQAWSSRDLSLGLETSRDWILKVLVLVLRPKVLVLVLKVLGLGYGLETSLWLLNKRKVLHFIFHSRYLIIISSSSSSSNNNNNRPFCCTW